MRRAIILGADGFLGRNLIRRLDELGGWGICGIGRDAGDLTDPKNADKALASAPESDVIFHVVTRQRTGQVQYGIQGEMLAINARIHLNVLEAWRRRQSQAKLLSMGSSCAYPESKFPLKEEIYGTGRAHPSVTGYALAKQVLATGAQTYAEQYGMKHLHCVLATMYGPHDHKTPDRSHFVGAMLDRAASEKRRGATAFEVWGDPKSVREVLYVDDQIDAVLAADRHFENRVLNTTAQRPVTVEETARGILNAMRWDADLVSPPSTFAGTAVKLLDSSNFLAATGWTPRFSLAEGLRRLIDLEYA